MKTAIISVGTELLFGSIVNTNAAYLSQELNGMGIDVLYHYTMGDNPGRLKRTLKFALEDCDLILITGGLGPTEDDLTKETVCELMGFELKKDEKIAADMAEFFKKVGFTFTENNLKQAWLPEGGTIFDNTEGTAPGFALEKDGKCIICMPGVPREMTAMFQKAAKPYLLKKADACIYSRAVRVFGVGESLVETMLLPFIDGQNDPTIATYAKEGIVEIRVTSKRKTEEEAKAAVEEMLEGVVNTLGDSVFTTHGEELQDRLTGLLEEKNLSIACFEGPSGGLFSAWLTQQKSLINLFRGAYTAENAESAAGIMGIDPAAFSEKDLYSPAGSERLASAVRAKLGADISMAVTGNAGPEEYEGCKPGSYYISIIYDGKTCSKEFYHKGRRRALNRDFMTQTVFDMLLKLLDGRDFTEVR